MSHATDSLDFTKTLTHQQFCREQKRDIFVVISLTFGMTDNMCQFSMLVKQHEIFRGEGHEAGEGRSGT